MSAMSRSLRRAAAALALTLGTSLGLVGAVSAASAAPAPLEQAHAHNDYEHDRPLRDALSHGFTSVEADVWLVDGRLLVAHDLADTRKKRTLESLYLDPLAKRARAKGGTIYPGWDGTFQLLIDVKSEALATYRALHDELRRHPRIMTRFVRGEERPAAVTAVVSGARDLAFMQDQKVRWAGYDGRLSDLESELPSALMPLVSDNWMSHFTWHGVGPMPEDQHAKLHDIVDAAHAAGYRVRFWGTPDWTHPGRNAVWDALLEAGVDHLNTDDLAGLRSYLRVRGR